MIEIITRLHSRVSDRDLLRHLADALDALECAGDRLNEIEAEEDARASADPLDDGDRAYDA